MSIFYLIFLYWYDFIRLVSYAHLMDLKPSMMTAMHMIDQDQDNAGILIVTLWGIANFQTHSNHTQFN